MHLRHLLIIALVLFGAKSAWSQVEPSATGEVTNRDEDLHMTIPPQVLGLSYAAAADRETKSNYLSGILAFNAAYNSNVLPGQASIPVADMSYSLWPTLRWEQTTSRQSRSFIYSSGYTFYQRTSVLDAVNQNASAQFGYRISPYTTISIDDSFHQNSNVYNQPYTIFSGTLSGVSNVPTAFVIAPYAEELTNTVNADFSYQFSRDAMVGGGGTFALLNFPNPSQVQGLYNSTTRSGVGFYDRRLGQSQYIGAIYQYSWIGTQSVSSTTQIQTISLFYSLSLHDELSLSLSSGPQYYRLTQPQVPATSKWTPYGLASIGWKRGHANLEADYARSVSAGQGLLGAYDSQSAGASARWQMTQTWTLASAASYGDLSNTSSSQSFSNPGGHAVSGTASVQHLIGEHISAELGYTRLHQSYASVASIVDSPDDNRAFLSISYQFTRPVGR
jgi:hypothetical protein